MDLSDVLFTEAEPTRTGGDVKQVARRLRQQGLSFEQIGAQLNTTPTSAFALVSGKDAESVERWRRRHFPAPGE